MSAYSRKKRAGKLPKAKQDRRTPPAVDRRVQLPKAGRQRPQITAAQAMVIEQAERDRRFYESLMRHST